MTVKMSSEGDTSKNISSETNEKSGTDHTDSSQDSQDVDSVKSAKPVENDSEKNDSEPQDKQEPKDESSETEEKPEKAEAKKENDNVQNDVDKKEKEEEKNDTKEEAENSEKTEEEEEEEEEEEDEADEKETKGKGKGKAKTVPLLDQPLETSGKRERKNVQRFNDEFPLERDSSSAKIEIPNGSGTALGEIPRVDASISRFKNEDLKLLHKVLFKTLGKTTLIKKNIRKFNGFDFKKDSEEYNKRVASLTKHETKHLKSICEMLDLSKTGPKDELVEKIMKFLLEPTDSGKPVGGGRPKRTAAVRANNRGYSSHDDYSSDEKPSRAKRGKGKRSSLKDESSSESDEEFQPSDGSEEKGRSSKRKRTTRKKVKSEEKESDEAEGEGEASGGSSEESEDEEPKGKRRKSVKANNKAKGKATPKRGRKPAAATPAKKPAAKANKKKSKESSEDEAEQSDHKEDAGSSSEDEPLAKKAKSTNPPTDDEIKTYIKEILEGANLEEITMKNVCQQVYAHYPDFDLAHKKEFIKSTVKSLIST